MKWWRLYCFFTVWAFTVFVVSLFFPVHKVFVSQVKTMIVVVILVALLLNVYYAWHYPFHKNRKRFWFEVVFHVIPFTYVLLSAPFTTDLTLVCILFLVYVAVMGPRQVYYAYQDPLAYLKRQ